MRFLICLLLLSQSLCAGTPQWIREQIAEDLSSASSARVHRGDVRIYFQYCDYMGEQALYCRIQNNHISWKSTAHTDTWRNPHIVSYFQGLAQRYSLPDIEFILFTADGRSSQDPIPVFAFSKFFEAKNTCLFPDFEMLWELEDTNKNWIPICWDYARQYPWEMKQELAFFRGGATGCWNSSLPDFGNDRVRLVIFSSLYPHLVDASISSYWQGESLSALLCSIEKPVSGASIETHFQYKYLFDIDGNACTYSRCRWILLSNSVLLKMMSGNSQWYYKALQPFVHFVPVKQDLSDVIGVLDFLKTHDGEARRIAEQGRMLGAELFSLKAVDQYVMTLLHEYSRRMVSD